MATGPGAHLTAPLVTDVLQAARLVDLKAAVPRFTGLDKDFAEWWKESAGPHQHDLAIASFASKFGVMPLQVEVPEGGEGEGDGKGAEGGEGEGDGKKPKRGKGAEA